MSKEVTPLVVSVPEAAVMLGTCAKTIWRMIGRRELASVMVGSSRKIKVKDIERYLDKNTVPEKRIA